MWFRSSNCASLKYVIEYWYLDDRGIEIHEGNSARKYESKILVPCGPLGAVHHGRWIDFTEVK